LELTQKCNSRCISCNTWRMQRTLLNDNTAAPVEELSFQEHVRIIDELGRLGCKEIELHGGEPLMYPKLAELVAHCSSLGISSKFATNGILMTAELAERLVNAGLTMIRFSLDGPKEPNNQLRGRQDAFDKQIRAMELFRAAGSESSVIKVIRTNVSSVNLERIDEVVDIARLMGIKRIQFAFHSTYDRAIVEETNDIFQEKVASLRSMVPDELLPKDVDLIREKRRQILQKAGVLGIYIDRTRFFSLPASEIPKGIKRDREPCILIYTRCYIDAFGNAIPCEYLRFSLGNVAQQSLTAIYQSERFNSFTRIYSLNHQNLRICDYCCRSL